MPRPGLRGQDMTRSAPADGSTSRAGGAEFLPKIFTVLREGYDARALRADVMAGLTVAIVALPLSMAIAIASGVGPERGLITAIVGGFVVSALGGSRFQIGGPAGAFIVLVSACVASIGLPGLLTAVALSGLFLTLAGALRLGSYVRFIPWPVTLGFTAGIAVIILASQIKDLAGLRLTAEPAAILPKLQALWAARESFSPPSALTAAAVVGLILSLRRLAPRAPHLLIAVALATLAVQAFGLPVETVQDRFGALPRTPPLPALPDLSPAALTQALPWALSFTLLGAIESLLSAVVADGMGGGRHRSNAELVAQGLANVASALFGGICVTGTIARTATNVRAGSRGPVSGMLHALFVLAFMALAAPLAGMIPLAALAGVLAVVAWNMAEKAEIRALMRSSRAEALVLVVTFLLVVFRDLTEGIVAGFALSGLVFLNRMSQAVDLRIDPAEGPDGIRVRLSGPWFFGAAAQAGATLERLAATPGRFVLDLHALGYIDSSGLHALELLARRLMRRGARLEIEGAGPALRETLEKAGLHAPDVVFIPALETAKAP